MDNFSERHGLSKLELQVSSLTDRTKEAIGSILTTGLNIIEEASNTIVIEKYVYDSLLKYHHHKVYRTRGLTARTDGNIDIPKQMLNSNYSQIFDFIEDVFKILDAIKNSKRYKDVDVAIIYIKDGINTVFIRFKVQFIIQSDYLIYPTFSDIENSQVEEILSFGDKVSEFISKALKEFSENPGLALGEVVKGLEQFFITDLKMNQKTLGKIVGTIKKKDSMLHLNDSATSSVISFLENISIVRNKTKGAGHAGTHDISIAESKYYIISAVTTINLLRTALDVPVK